METPDQITHQRNALITAIKEAVIKCKIVNEQIDLTGPHLLMLCDDMATYILHLEREINAKQAEIDRLMLEYCQNEMTPEQLKNWGDHQRRAQDD